MFEGGKNSSQQASNSVAIIIAPVEFPKILARIVQTQRFEVACPKLFGQVDACVLSTMYHEKLSSSQQLVVLVLACRAVSIELEKDSISRPSAVVEFKVHLNHENF